MGKTTGADNPNPAYQVIVSAFVIVLSFTLGLSMVNILIAVLSKEYEDAAANAFRSFMHVRACMAIDHFLILEGFKTIRHCRRRSVHSMTQEHSQNQRDSLVADWGAERCHVWYCMANE